MRNGPYELVIAPDGYPGKRYRGRYCYEHHLVWWRAYGTVPSPEECIHHINENRRDNRIENLRLKAKRRHTSEHNRRRGRLMVKIRCPVCGTIFVKERRHTYLINKRDLTVCSRKCGGKLGKMTDDEREEVGKQSIMEIFRSFPPCQTSIQDILIR